MNYLRRVKKMPNDIPQMMTIKETAKNTGLAEYYIRQCCLNNKIVYVRCGKRILVNFNKFIEFLNTGEQINQAEQPQTKIRKLY